MADSEKQMEPVAFGPADMGERFAEFGHATVWPTGGAGTRVSSVPLYDRPTTSEEAIEAAARLAFFAGWEERYGELLNEDAWELRERAWLRYRRRHFGANDRRTDG